MPTRKSPVELFGAIYDALPDAVKDALRVKLHDLNDPQQDFVNFAEAKQDLDEVMSSVYFAADLPPLVQKCVAYRNDFIRNVGNRAPRFLDTSGQHRPEWRGLHDGVLDLADKYAPIEEGQTIVRSRDVLRDSQIPQVDIVADERDMQAILQVGTEIRDIEVSLEPFIARFGADHDISRGVLPETLLNRLDDPEDSLYRLFEDCGARLAATKQIVERHIDERAEIAVALADKSPISDWLAAQGNTPFQLRNTLDNEPFDVALRRVIGAHMAVEELMDPNTPLDVNGPSTLGDTSDSRSADNDEYEAVASAASIVLGAFESDYVVERENAIRSGRMVAKGLKAKPFEPPFKVLMADTARTTAPAAGEKTSGIPDGSADLTALLEAAIQSVEDESVESDLGATRGNDRPDRSESISNGGIAP
jgi:hypothetical protein